MEKTITAIKELLPSKATVANKCNMCGQCCSMIHLREEIHEAVVGKMVKAWKGIDFVIENFEYIGMASKVGGLLHKNLKTGKVIDSYVYRCKLLTEDNKCSIHESKPYICSGYPWYGTGKNQYDSAPFPYKGCGYERESYEMRLLVILQHHLYNLENKESSGKKEELCQPKIKS